MTQLDLFGKPLCKEKRAQFLKMKLGMTKTKFYKKCASKGCSLSVVNKPWNNYCWQCLIDFYYHNSILSAQYKPIEIFVCESSTSGDDTC